MLQRFITCVEVYPPPGSTSQPIPPGCQATPSQLPAIKGSGSFYAWVLYLGMACCTELDNHHQHEAWPLTMYSWPAPHGALQPGTLASITALLAWPVPWLQRRAASGGLMSSSKCLHNVCRSLHAVEAGLHVGRITHKVVPSRAGFSPALVCSQPHHHTPHPPSHMQASQTASPTAPSTTPWASGPAGRPTSPTRSALLALSCCHDLWPHSY